MRIGVISEGHADRAVITNIIKGLTGFDSSNIIALKPTYKSDKTDKVNVPQNISSYSVIKEECESRDLIDEFLAIEGQEFVIIHIDTAEAEHYGITRPDRKDPGYCKTLRELVVKQIDNWLGEEASESFLHAVAIEEIDAWILPIYDNRDSTMSAKPKEKLAYILGKSNINSTSNYDNFLLISKSLSKTKIIKKDKLLSYNCSLEEFYNEVVQKVLPLIAEE